MHLQMVMKLHLFNCIMFNLHLDTKQLTECICRYVKLMWVRIREKLHLSLSLCSGIMSPPLQVPRVLFSALMTLSETKQTHLQSHTNTHRSTAAALVLSEPQIMLTKPNLLISRFNLFFGTNLLWIPTGKWCPGESVEDDVTG